MVFAEFPTYIAIFIATLILSALLTRAVIGVAGRSGWAAEQNDRSCHTGAVLIGGGGPVVVLTLGAWIIWAGPIGPLGLAVMAGAAGLAIISWIDDLKTVHLGVRLVVQIAVVALCLSFLPADQRIFSQDWPLLADRLLIGFFWLWFINLFNFMDGIDGLAASETIAVSIGIILVGSLIGLGDELLVPTTVLAGATAGFLLWNWHKARIMLGDLGSIPIGFLIGYLLIKLAVEGYMAPALILPLYFLADANVTLARRILRRERFWRPHREHFYQRAVMAGIGHDHVVLKVTAANIVLIGAALLSISRPVLAVLIAAVTVILLMGHLFFKARG